MPDLRRMVVILIVACMLLSLVPSLAVAEELPYAYVVRVTMDNWFESYRFINTLIYSGVRVYWAQKSFTAADRNFSAGDFIIPVRAPCIGWDNLPSAKVNEIVLETVKNHPKVELVRVDEEFKAEVLVLKPARVAIYGDQISNCFVFYGLIKTLGFKADIVTGMEVRAGVLRNYNVFALPGDSLPQLYSLGIDGCNEVKKFIINGGGLIASCAGTIATASEAPGEVWPQKKWLQVGRWYLWNVNTSEPFPTFPGYYNPPGIGLIMLKNENPNHPVMFGIPDIFMVVHWQGPVLKPVPVGYIMWPKVNLTARTVEWEEQWLSNPIPLASYYDWTNRFTFFEYYYNLTGQKIATPKELSETWLGRAISEKLYSLMAGYMGNGKVVVAGSHPELGLRLSLEFKGSVDVQARIFANAILWETSEPRYNPVSFPVEYGVEKVISMKDRLHKLFNELKSLSPTAPKPLVEQAYSTFGMSPDEKWRWLLIDIPKTFDELSDSCELALKTLSALQDELNELQSIEDELLSLKLKGFNVEKELSLLSDLKSKVINAIRDINEDINYIYPEEWTPPDSTPPRFYAGAEVKMGVLQVLDLATTRLEIVVKALKGEGEWPTYIWGVDALLGGYGLDGFLSRCISLLSGDSVEAQIVLAEVSNGVEEFKSVIDELKKMPTAAEVRDELSARMSSVEERIGELRTEIERIVGEKVSAAMTGVYGIAALVGIICGLAAAFIGQVLMKKIKL